MTDDALTALLRRYADCEISAQDVVRSLAPDVSVAEVILEIRRRIGRLPDPSGPFVEGERRRGLALLVGSASCRRPRRRRGETGRKHAEHALRDENKKGTRSARGRGWESPPPHAIRTVTDVAVRAPAGG